MLDYFTMPAAFLAFFVKGLTGFANTLVFGSLLSFRQANVEITPVDMLLGFPSNLIITIAERKHIVWKVALPLFILSAAGMLPGVFILKAGDQYILKAIMGVVIILLAVEMLLRGRTGDRKKASSRQQSKAVLIAIGVVSGLLTGIFGIGAFLTAYVSRTTSNMREFRGNLCLVFLLMGTLQIVLYAATGILHAGIVTQALWLIPAMLTGLALGSLAARKIDPILAKKVICVVLLLSGAAVLVKNVGPLFA